MLGDGLDFEASPDASDAGCALATGWFAWSGFGSTADESTEALGCSPVVAIATTLGVDARKVGADALPLGKLGEAVTLLAAGAGVINMRAEMIPRLASAATMAATTASLR